jgi:hypothetical protein
MKLLRVHVIQSGGLPPACPSLKTKTRFSDLSA